MNEKSATPISKEHALDIARKKIATLKPGTELVILEEKTVEKDFGWVFFYTTKKYLQSHNPGDLLPGNSPLVVERADGSTHFLSTSLPPNRAIDEYESVWRKRKAGSE
jgi:Immunity protein 35